MGKYYVIQKNAEATVIEKKSRFIAKAFTVNSEEEATALLNDIKKKYWDARHNCYAFVIGDNNECQRCSDDGEPSGTAGKPILEVIHGNELHNCMVVVTRYFGGILLGTGGLVRAYQQATIDALNNAGKNEIISGKRINIKTDYSSYSKLMHLTQKLGIEIKNVEYTDNIIAYIETSEEAGKKLMEEFTELTAGQAEYEVENDVKICVPVVE